MAPDAPVHHIRGRDDVGAGLDLDQGLFGEHFYRFVVEDAPVAEEPVMAMVGERIERHIGHEPHVRGPRPSWRAGLCR